MVLKFFSPLRKSFDFREKYLPILCNLEVGIQKKFLVSFDVAKISLRGQKIF